MSVLSSLLKGAFRARAPEPGTAHRPDQLDAIRARAAAGDLAGAIRQCDSLLAAAPDNPAALDLMLDLRHAVMLDEVRQHFPGPDYMEWLQWFHATLAPRTYLEIGVASGMSLQHVRPQTKAAGVDPAFNITFPQTAWVKLFRETSDDFFANRSMQEVFGEDAVDLVFLDGLHTFDQTLRDLLNVERHCHARSVVLLHDILPVIPETAERERRTIFWVGDTWKMMVLLARHRPDLNFFTIPAFPSGLGVVTGLDAASPHATALRSNLDTICSEAMGLELKDFLPELTRHQRVVANDRQEVLSRLGSIPG
jgi:hypothetical protein